MNSTTGIRGVFPYCRGGYRVQFKINKRWVYLGYHKKLNVAAQVARQWLQTHQPTKE